MAFSALFTLHEIETKEAFQLLKNDGAVYGIQRETTTFNFLGRKHKVQMIFEVSEKI